jgi:hypothetical protein
MKQEQEQIDPNILIDAGTSLISDKPKQNFSREDFTMD